MVELIDVRCPKCNHLLCRTSPSGTFETVCRRNHCYAKVLIVNGRAQVLAERHRGANDPPRPSIVK